MVEQSYISAIGAMIFLNTQLQETTIRIYNIW